MDMDKDTCIHIDIDIDIDIDMDMDIDIDTDKSTPKTRALVMATLTERTPNVLKQTVLGTLEGTLSKGPCWFVAALQGLPE